MLLFGEHRRRSGACMVEYINHVSMHTHTFMSWLCLLGIWRLLAAGPLGSPTLHSAPHAAPGNFGSASLCVMKPLWFYTRELDA